MNKPGFQDRLDEAELLKAIESERRRLADLSGETRRAQARLAALGSDLASARAPRRTAHARWAFALFAAALLPVMVLSSTHFGITWDEFDRHANGEHVWEFLRGRASRASFIEDDGGLYGGLFDLICAALLKWLPLDTYVLRHAVGAVFGWIGVVYCGRLAWRLFSPWAGVLAMVLLSMSPRYFADSMNNPKDLPFAVASVVALYYISTVSPKWPYLSLSTALKITAVLALALNIRAGALLYLGYFGLLVIAFVIAERNWNWRRLADTATRLAAVTVATLLLGTVFWPWAGAAPLTRPIIALLGFAEYHYGPAVLFAGQWMYNTDLPWYYAPWWFLMSTPPVVIAGVGAALALGSPNRGYTLRKCALWTVAALPVVLVIARHSSLYDGIRHLLFVYLVLVALAASGWALWLSERSRPWMRRSAAVLLAAGLINILIFDIRFHPNETVYFNELVGGPRGAFARYDMDYWGNCIFEAVAWSAQTARLSGMPVAISGSGDPKHVVRLEAERFPQLLWAPAQSHLDVRLNRGPAHTVTALANQKDVVHKVTTADGVVLCVVLPGPRFAELQPRLSMPDKRFSYSRPWR